MKYSKIFSFILCIFAITLLFAACSTAQEPTVATVSTEESVKTRTVVESFTTTQNIGGMTLNFKTEFVYDELGLVVENISYNNGEESSRTIMENDEHGEVIRQTTESQGFTSITESQLTYDDAGNLVKRIDTEAFNGEIVNIREYNYDPVTHKHIRVRFEALGDTPVITDITYAYDDYGNQISEEQVNNGIAYARYTEYEYDAEGRILKGTDRSEKQEITGYYECIYEDNGDLTQLSYYPDGTLQSKTVTTRNDHGQPILTQTWQGEILTLETRYTYITVPAYK